MNNRFTKNTFPPKWEIGVNNDNRQMILNWRIESSPNFKDIWSYIDHNREGWDHSTQSIQITTEEFKEFVLNNKQSIVEHFNNYNYLIPLLQNIKL